MNTFENLFPENLYHSYIVEGDPKTTVFALRDFLINKGYIASNNPDLFIEVYDSFNISNSEKLKEWHSQKKTTEDKRVCIIGANFINREAERTLLKIIEEHTLGTHFFIVVPNASILLDTIRSRVHIINTINPLNSIKELSEEAYEFILMKPKDRIDFVSKVIKDYKNSSSSELRYFTTNLINEIEKQLFENFKKDKYSKILKFKLNELENNKNFLNSPGCSVKMILEHLALVL